ncbi:hypothetical protein HYC85_028152 [Camellia sinensis]|uniref:Protein kinase domain-containing protein n=1 Tax=Camellia sinensis TaxID=4442 RepID=A0A7J7FVH3_CAMSI|nr:hypothetical protein HYC85_028152 [Camellia sinensis]
MTVEITKRTSSKMAAEISERERWTGSSPSGGIVNSFACEEEEEVDFTRKTQPLPSSIDCGIPEVDAMVNISLTYGVKKNWQGDPCKPMNSSWYGVNCSYNGNNSPKVMSLNLSSSHLTGEIAPALSVLKSLKDLSYNSLTGHVPEFLSELPALEILTLKSKNRRFSYSEVVRITNKFERVIGKGGFGTVYLGYLSDGTEVAVKMLSRLSSQGSEQFWTEAELLTTVHHRNLASLIGYCDEGSNTALIYEYMANGNLQECLLDKNRAVLTWEQRLQIAVDVAQALEYLHDGCKPPIIHRDIKTANILLNEKLQAKVADFGLSRIFPVEDGTHVSTAVVGTFGYLDPEYYITSRLTEKSDVYSFGVVLCELITGQPAIIKSHDNENTHIVQWVTPMLERGEISDIVDPRDCNGLHTIQSHPKAYHELCGWRIKGVFGNICSYEWKNFRCGRSFIIIDCGIPDGYTDETTNIYYSSDANFVDNGINSDISGEYKTGNLDRRLANLRSFPQGIRNCYTLRPQQDKNNNYLMRAWFLYGNYDGKNNRPRFDMYIGVNLWDRVQFLDDSEVVTKESYIGLGTPFISALELKHLNNSIYKSQSGGMGGTNSISFYVYLHFCELEKLQDNAVREFDILLNWNSWVKSVIRSYLKTNTSSKESPRSIERTKRSTLPPILNAMEFYVEKDMSELPTDAEDCTFTFFSFSCIYFYIAFTVTTSNSMMSGLGFKISRFDSNLVVDAMVNISLTYRVKKNWQGDPCKPMEFSWNNVNCSYNGNNSPKITNLSSSDLTGEIAPALFGLKSLKNLTSNNLTGSVPKALTENTDGNPNLCRSDSYEQATKKKKNWSTTAIVASIVSSIWRKHKGNVGGRTLKLKNRRFSYSEVVSIINNFERIIGNGGFRTVYLGYLKDGTEVAVKMLSRSSSQGSEQNLAALIGYCDESSNTALIYEYMINGNLQECLLGNCKNTYSLKFLKIDKKRAVLTWEQRLQIAIDAAQAFEYLHDGCKPPIIHKDIKTANILLNEKLQAKVADFGSSRIFPIEDGNHVSTAVVGTFGYLDPELTEKSDVYSFGVVLFELITGQPAIIKSCDNENTHIVQWVMPMLERGEISNIVDPRLQGDFDSNSVWKTLETAMACVPPSPIQRPTMSRVVGELKECLEIHVAMSGKDLDMTEVNRMTSSNAIDNFASLDLESSMSFPQARISIEISGSASIILKTNKKMKILHINPILRNYYPFSPKDFLINQLVPLIL